MPSFKTSIVLATLCGGSALLLSELMTVRPPENIAPLQSELHEGSVLPEISFDAIDKSVTPFAKIAAPITVITFWASWCDACMEEMPSLVQLAKSYPSTELQVIGVSVDDSPESAIPRTKARFSIDFPLFTDTSGRLSDLFAVRAIPRTVVLNKNRKVLMMQHGGEDWNAPAFHNQIKQWLGK